jgi:hypothetical protein
MELTLCCLLKDPFVRKNGKVRKSYRLPHFSNRHNWSLRDTYLEDIFNKAQEYDSANGHIFPDSSDWVDAFAEPNGNNAKFKKFWSPLNNAFKQNWSENNIYAFPPMNEDIISKTLQYHVAQQQVANSKGQAFRGIYIVPYQPSASFWKYTSNFQLLKYFRVGTPLFQSVGKHGKPHAIQTSVPMCVLYDMGYTIPNYQLAYLHAMDLASSALDRCAFDYPLDCFDWIDHPTQLQPSSNIEQPQLENTHTPSVHHIYTHCTSECDGHIEDITPPSKVFPISEDIKQARLANIRIQNMLHCSGEPIEILSQVTTHTSRIDKELAKLQSLGKLSNILEQDNPDWDSVDDAIHKHIHTLLNIQEMTKMMPIP